MAARSLQSLTITFGLVTIPVRLYAATNPRAGISFNLLHSCGSRVRQQYFCIAEDKPVARDELVKGYEFEKDHYVTFTKDELQKLEAAASEAVEIVEFVDASSVDPVFYEKAYYVAPDKGGAKPYALLAESMRKSKRTAIGRWAARGKQYLVQLRVTEDDALVMQQLLYADEVRSIREVEIPEAKVNDKELALAQQLIDSITNDKGFDPSAFHDEVKERIEEQIQQKVAGQEIAAPEAPVAPGGAKVIDIMEALRASLKAGPRKVAPAKEPVRIGAKETAAPTRASKAAKKTPTTKAARARKTGRKAA
jgi:DNA end-binding protein Ku